MDVCYIGGLRPHIAHGLDGLVAVAHVEFSYLVVRGGGEVVMPPDPDYPIDHRHLDLDVLTDDLPVLRAQAEDQVLSVYTDHDRESLAFVWLDG